MKYAFILLMCLALGFAALEYNQARSWFSFVTLYSVSAAFSIWIYSKPSPKTQ